MNLEELVLPLRTDSSKFKAGITAAAAGVTALVAGMGLAIKASFKWSAEMDSLGDVIGGTNKELAALNFIARKSGVSIDTFAKGNVIMEKGLLKSNGTLDTVGKKLEEFGIKVLGANGVVKDQVQLTDEIAAKYGTLATAQERVNFLTEVYGKSGAELVDFFDTLAADGGIDKVAEKVERLGLAIDPGRYEQFNRNLEELKLVGLGMAVGFTEKVMPAIEGFLALVSDPKLTLKSFSTKADDFIGGIIDGLATSVENWNSGGGPEELSDKLISWVENLGEGEASKSKIIAGGQKLVTAIGTALKEIDFTGIATAIDEKTAETISGHDWLAAGTSFGDKVEEAFRNALTGENKPEVGDQWGLEMLSPGISALYTFFHSETGAALGTAVQDWLKGAFGPQSQTVISTWAADTNTKLATWQSTTGTKFQTWASGVNTTVDTWASTTKEKITTALSTMKTTIDDKLRDIAKTFYNRALAWGQQMKSGFDGGMGALLTAVTGLVAKINSILNKIRTSFAISFSFGTGSMGNHPTGGGGGGTGAAGSAGAGGIGGSGVGGQYSQFASGGSFVIPSRYGYEGFGMGGIATASAGELVTISPRGGAQQVTIANWNGFDYHQLASQIATQVVKAMNNA